MATLRQTVWIEDTSGEVHEFMQSIPPEISAENKELADLLVVIEVVETQGDPMSVSGGCGGSVDRYKVDYSITLIKQKTEQNLATTLLEGYFPGGFRMLSSCDPLRGRPTFEVFFHWLAPYAYLVATPTPTSTYTPSLTYTPWPTATATP